MCRSAGIEKGAKRTRKQAHPVPALITDPALQRTQSNFLLTVPAPTVFCLRCYENCDFHWWVRNAYVMRLNSLMKVRGMKGYD